jgi:hypothetical protein
MVLTVIALLPNSCANVLANISTAALAAEYGPTIGVVPVFRPLPITITRPDDSTCSSSTALPSTQRHVGEWCTVV